MSVNKGRDGEVLQAVVVEVGGFDDGLTKQEVGAERLYGEPKSTVAGGGLVVEDDVAVRFALMSDENDVEPSVVVYVDDLGIACGVDH